MTGDFLSAVFIVVVLSFCARAAPTGKQSSEPSLCGIPQCEIALLPCNKTGDRWIELAKEYIQYYDTDGNAPDSCGDITQQQVLAFLVDHCEPDSISCGPDALNASAEAVYFIATLRACNGDRSPCAGAGRCTQPMEAPCSGRQGRFNVGLRQFYIVDHTYEAFRVYNVVRANQMWPENQRYRILTVLYPTMDADGEPVVDLLRGYERGELSPERYNLTVQGYTLVFANASLALPCACTGGLFDALIFVHGFAATDAGYFLYGVKSAASGRIVVMPNYSNEESTYGTLRGTTANDVARVKAWAQMVALDMYQRPFLARAAFDWVVSGAATDIYGTPFSAAYSGRVVVGGHSLGAATALAIGGVAWAACSIIYQRVTTSPTNGFLLFNSPQANATELCAALHDVGSDSTLSPITLWPSSFDVESNATTVMAGTVGVLLADMNTNAPFANATDIPALLAEAGTALPSAYMTRVQNRDSEVVVDMAALYSAIDVSQPSGAYGGPRFKLYAQSIGTWHNSYVVEQICPWLSAAINQTANAQFFATVGVDPLYYNDPFYKFPSPFLNGLVGTYVQFWCPSQPIVGPAGPNSIPPWPPAFFPPRMQQCMCTNLSSFAMVSRTEQIFVLFEDSVARGCAKQGTVAPNVLEIFRKNPLVFSAYAYADAFGESAGDEMIQLATYGDSSAEIILPSSIFG